MSEPKQINKTLDSIIAPILTASGNTYLSLNDVTVIVQYNSFSIIAEEFIIG